MWTPPPRSCSESSSFLLRIFPILLVSLSRPVNYVPRDFEVSGSRARRGFIDITPLCWFCPRAELVYGRKGCDVRITITLYFLYPSDARLELKQSVHGPVGRYDRPERASQRRYVRASLSRAVESSESSILIVFCSVDMRRYALRMARPPKRERRAPGRVRR